MTDRRINLVIRYLETTSYPERNVVIFLLSCKAGLRAKEIALIEWDNVLCDDSLTIGDKLQIFDGQSKGKRGGRAIYINQQLKAALKDLYEKSERKPRLNDNIVKNCRGQRFTPNGIVKLFYYWFKDLELGGFSSHSGRRTFITNMARIASLHGASIIDVKAMAGHRFLTSTQEYVEINPEAQRAMVGAI